jgi:hypothetical protein
VIVVERGKARRLRLEVDLSWETVAVHGSEQVLELNSKKIKTAGGRDTGRGLGPSSPLPA